MKHANYLTDLKWRDDEYSSILYVGRYLRFEIRFDARKKVREYYIELNGRRREWGLFENLLAAKRYAEIRARQIVVEASSILEGSDLGK